jgi:peroxisomal coenzyme A diphosphatase NUDT7
MEAFMDIETIKQKYKNVIAKPLEINQFFSVLLPLITVDEELHILFEVRSKSVHQPGEVSFPGGRVEADETYKEAAIRETQEEIGIARHQIEIIGELDYIMNVSNFILYPYVGILHDDAINLIINKEEVEEIFTVPLRYFLENEPEEYHLTYKTDLENGFPFYKIPNGENYQWRKIGYPVLFYHYKGYMIWGMTAKITRSFVNRLCDSSSQFSHDDK